MHEIKVTIEAPALAEAITALANAMQARSAIVEPAKNTRSKKTEVAEKVAPAHTQTPVTPDSAAMVQSPVVSAPTPVMMSSVVPQNVAAAAPAVSAPAPLPSMPTAVPTAPAMPPVTPQMPPVAPPIAHSATPTPAPIALTQEALSSAGVELLDKGMMAQLLELLGRFGVQSITQLQPTQFEAFAAGLRALGAAI